ncbi:hypothetical protein GCM10010517_27020 [Streptosporangium fragile]|uniref:Uncharacterized protein n=1 Tax=Streptosporangium fragile TaxID=46186 RepID=A0ABP6IFC6_9ACTN
MPRLFLVLAVLLLVATCGPPPVGRTRAPAEPSRTSAGGGPGPTPDEPAPVIETSALPGRARTGQWRQAAVNHGDHSTAVHDLVVLGDGTAYAVGGIHKYGRPGGLLLQRWDGSTWRQEAGPRVPVAAAAERLVSGTSADDLWIIDPGGAATVEAHDPGVRAFHRAGGTWSSTLLGNTVRQFYPLDLDVVAPGAAWAVGCDTHAADLMKCPSTVVEFRGGAWQRHSVPITARSLSGRGPSDVWVVGHDPVTGQPAAASFDGVAWTRQSLPRLPKPTGGRIQDWHASLLDMLFTGDDELLAVGYVRWVDVGPSELRDGHEQDDGDDRFHVRSLVMRYSAGRWSYRLGVDGPAGDRLELAPAGRGDAWATDGTSRLWRLSGTRWVKQLDLRETSIEAIASWPGAPTAWAATVTETSGNGTRHRQAAYWRVD